MNSDPAEFVRKELPGTLKKLRGYAILMAGSQDADDILQTTALKALENAHQFTVGTSLQGWLYRIMVNEFRDDRRKRKYRDHPDIAAVDEHHISRPGNQETIVLLREVVAAVSRLKPTFRDVIMSSCLRDEEMHYRENRPGVMRSRLFHARIALKEMTA